MKPQDLPIEKRLIQLAEECSELSQAALKLVRAMDGDTPVPVREATGHLLEEMADVYVTALALKPDRMTIEAIARRKNKRWEERLNKRWEERLNKQDAFTKWAQSVADDYRRKSMEEGHDEARDDDHG